MPTTKLLVEKLKDTRAYVSALENIKVNIGILEHIFSISGAIMKTKSLVDDGIPLTFTELLLPHLVTSFGPALIANGIYTRFKPTLIGFGVYILGFFLSLFVQDKGFIMFVVREMPHIGKFFTLARLKNTKDDTMQAFSWVITAEFVGQFLTKVVLNKSFKVKTVDLLKTVSVYGGLLALRHYDMPDYMVIIVANIVPLMLKLGEYLKSRRSGGKKDSKKHPKRKASLGLQAEKNK